MEAVLTYRVLVVKDESPQRVELASVLSEAGYNVAVARNGKDALAMICATPPDVVLTDIEMPEMDGYQLCRLIRRDQGCAGTRVILLTSHADIADVVKGLESGADNYVAKPCDSAVILEVVQSLLERPPERRDGQCDDVLPVRFGEGTVEVRCTRLQVVNFFLSMYRDVIASNKELVRAQEQFGFLSANLTCLVEEKTTELRDEILQRRKAEEESRYQAALLDKAHEAIILTDVDGCVRFWNLGAQRQYGWAASELAGRPLGSVLHDEQCPAPSDAVRITLERGEWEGELVQRARDGEERFVQSSWTLVREEDGSLKGILMINVDITERKKLEAKFLRTQRLESIGMLAGGIAHDLNNLVGPIPLAVELIRKKTDDPKIGSTLRLIETGAQRALDVVHQVLAFSRGTTGVRVPLQPQHLLQEMREMARGSFPPSIDVRLEYPPRLSTVLGDATQLHQVIMNLCVNARDAMPNGGLLVLSAEDVAIDPAYAAMHTEARAGRYVRLSVKDTGTGIPADVREKIFDPFFTTKDPGAGTGLGLSTVLSIVQGHGGFLQIESEPGSGTEFRVFLPAAEGAEKHLEVTEELPVPRGNGELVLLIDDEIMIREVLGSTLEEAGYRVLKASDGIHALALFAREGELVSAVVVDLLLPDLDGISTIKTLRKMSPSVPIIAITGHEDAGKQAALQLPPFIALLRKPFSGPTLISEVCAAIHDRRLAEDVPSAPGHAL